MSDVGEKYWLSPFAQAVITIAPSVRETAKRAGVDLPPWLEHELAEAALRPYAAMIDGPLLPIRVD